MNPSSFSPGFQSARGIPPTSPRDSRRGGFHVPVRSLRLSAFFLDTLSLCDQRHIDHPRQHGADFVITQHSASALLSPCAGNQFSTGEIANALKLWTKTRNDVYRQ